MAALDWSRVGRHHRARVLPLHGRLANAPVARSPHRDRQPAQQVAPVDGRSPTAAPRFGSDKGAVTRTSGFLHWPENTPDELLTDLAAIAHIMGEVDGNRSKLIAVMMANKWEFAVDAIESEFPGESISVILDDIISIALDEKGHTLTYEGDGLWNVMEEYRDEAVDFVDHPYCLSA